MAMTEQTRRTIAALKAVGLPRSTFSVNVEVDKNGEYGVARVVFYGPMKRVLELVPAMIETGELDVTVFTLELGDGSRSLAHALVTSGCGRKTVVNVGG